MPSTSPLTEFEERILLALWKLKGIGRVRVAKASVITDPTLGTVPDLVKDEIGKLLSRGFLEAANVNGHDALSLTPLGLAILRQIEEDRLQELK